MEKMNKTQWMELIPEGGGNFFTAGYQISRKVDIMAAMDALDVFKALSNETRLKILELLKDPASHFHLESGVDMERVGVCVGEICRVTGLTQSTVSVYLSQLEKAGLLESTRIGKWTYYRRDKDAFKRIADYVRDNL